MRKPIPISEAAKLLGVHADTLRRWEREGKIKPRRTSGNLRRYDIADIRPILSTLRLRLRVRPWLTTRVSSHDQKEDLERQKQVLESYCAAQGWGFRACCRPWLWHELPQAGCFRRLRPATTRIVPSRISGHQPAVDRDHGAGQERGRRKAQAQRHVGDLFRVPVAAECGAALGVDRLVLFRNTVRDRGADRPRTDAVDGD